MTVVPSTSISPIIARPTPRMLLPATEERPRNSKASLVQLADRALLMVWSAFTSPGDNDAATIDSLLSRHGGDTWPWSRRKPHEDHSSATYYYPNCLFVGDRAFVTYQSTPTPTPTPAPGEPPRRVREFKPVWLPLSWLYS